MEDPREVTVTEKEEDVVVLGIANVTIKKEKGNDAADTKMELTGSIAEIANVIVRDTAPGGIEATMTKTENAGHDAANVLKTWIVRIRNGQGRI